LSSAVFPLFAISFNFLCFTWDFLAVLAMGCTTLWGCLLSCFVLIAVNSSRGNKFFGDCTLSKVKSCMVPAHQEAAPDTATDFNSWTPPAQVLDCSWILCALVSFYNGRLQAILFLVWGIYWTLDSRRLQNLAHSLQPTQDFMKLHMHGIPFILYIEPHLHYCWLSIGTRGCSTSLTIYGSALWEWAAIRNFVSCIVRFS